jgi:hypothetical protein
MGFLVIAHLHVTGFEHAAFVQFSKCGIHPVTRESALRTKIVLGYSRRIDGFEFEPCQLAVRIELGFSA